jgi:hypothetical protein
MVFFSVPLTGQETHIGLLGGSTTAETYRDEYYQGALAGLFAQTVLSDHVQIRSEANWARTAVLERPAHHAPTMSSTWPPPTVVEFAEVNLQVRLGWRSDPLPVLESRIGLSTFGGGWLGTRLHGEMMGTKARRLDFGHLVGLGLSWWWNALLIQVDARYQEGERRLYSGGPTRKGSRLALGLGYRIH